MNVISDEYRRLNAKLHEDRTDYGAGVQTKQWYPMVSQFAQVLGAASVLDYGCGKNRMKRELPHLMIIPYDPAIPEYADPPDQHDLVVCLDVLEHIEPELLDSVLADIRRCAKLAVFLTVHLGPAHKVLADGRNAHLIQKPIGWWLPKLMEFWDLTAVRKANAHEFLFTGRPHEMNDAEVAKRAAKRLEAA
jgi:hypothetical protein